MKQIKKIVIGTAFGYLVMVITLKFAGNMTWTEATRLGIDLVKLAS